MERIKTFRVIDEFENDITKRVSIEMKNGGIIVVDEFGRNITKIVSIISHYETIK